VADKLKYRSCPFALKSMGEEEDDKPGIFTGLTSVFCNVDSVREIVAPGAFAGSIEHFLNKGFITHEHHWEKPIGKPKSAVETPEGLLISGIIYPDMFDGKSVLAGMRRDIYKEMSIGFYVEDSIELSFEAVQKFWAEKGYMPTTLDIRRAANGVVLLTKIKLEESAICIRGANQVARITGVKSNMVSLFRNLFGLSEKAEETTPEPTETAPANEPAKADEINEKALDDIVEGIVAACRPAIKAAVTQMAEAAACKVAPKVPEAKSPEGDDVDDDALDALASFILSEDSDEDD